MVENWQCQTCKLCMDKPFVEEHTRLTGHKNIVKTDPWKVVNEQIKILLVAHGSMHNDTICTVERKVTTHG